MKTIDLSDSYTIKRKFAPKAGCYLYYVRLTGRAYDSCITADYKTAKRFALQTEECATE